MMGKIQFSIYLLVSFALCGCKTEVDTENACAEVTATRVIESSKRMEILKSYGYKPVQAQIFESALMDTNKILDRLSEPDPLDISGQFQTIQNKKIANICLNQYGLLCTQLLTRVGAGETEDDISPSIVKYHMCYQDITKKIEVKAHVTDYIKQQARIFTCEFSEKSHACDCYPTDRPKDYEFVSKSTCEGIAEYQAALDLLGE
ncbi:hypothetical protein ACFL00_02780 [Pseudomonadota bacterium]